MAHTKCFICKRPALDPVYMATDVKGVAVVRLPQGWQLDETNNTVLCPSCADLKRAVK